MSRLLPTSRQFEAFVSDGRLLPLAATVGLVGGIVGVVYLEALNALSQLLFPAPWADTVKTYLPTPIDTTITWNPWHHWLVLITAGVITAIVFKYLGNPADTELLVDNIHLHGEAPKEGMRELRALIPVSLLNIAVGSGIGPEAPLSQTNGTLASWFAERWKLEPVEARILTITGMAAGFTVLFDAPLGATIFSMEMLHRRGLRYFEVLLPVLVGSLCAFVLYSGLTSMGLEPIWHIDGVLGLPYSLGFGDFAWGLAAGVVGAIIAAVFTYLVVFTRWLYRPLPPLTKPVVTGVVLGALAFASPYALTFSKLQLRHLGRVETITLGALGLAVVTKLIAAAISMAGGWKGGFIIPMFFAGYCLGRIGAEVLPGHPNGTVLAVCLMVAINVGVTKTPLGSTLVVTEMVGLKLLPPALIAGLISFFLTSNVYLISSQRRREGLDGEHIDPGVTRFALDPRNDRPSDRPRLGPFAARPTSSTNPFLPSLTVPGSADADDAPQSLEPSVSPSGEPSGDPSDDPSATPAGDVVDPDRLGDAPGHT